MCLTNYIEYPSFELSPENLYKIQNLNWEQLCVTTELTKWTVFEKFVRHSYLCNWKAINFIKRYGIFGQHISTLKNIRLPDEIEQEICQQVKHFFNINSSPVVRLQVVFGGKIVPMHTDPTRELSFIIPIMNHANSFTRFYQTGKVEKFDGLCDPGNCVCVDQIEILVPTLINTKQIHSVEFNNIYTKTSPRISITAKWQTGNLIPEQL